VETAVRVTISAGWSAYTNTTEQGSDVEFDAAFDPPALVGAYEEHIKPRGGRGFDRLGIDAFDLQREAQLRILHRKALAGTYRFAPYLEQLVVRGPQRPPRVISVPTLRDRVALRQLKVFLEGPFAKNVERRLPNDFIRQIKQFAATQQLGNVGVLRADISSFYDTIDHDLLIQRLKSCVASGRAIDMVRRALRAPTLSALASRAERHRHRNKEGVPQGLAISNLLASVYLAELDMKFQKSTRLYLRYVDDIVMFVPLKDLEYTKLVLAKELAELGLTMNATKAFEGKATDPFEFLGYSLSLPHTSVRRPTVERFLRAIAAKFSAYHHLSRANKHPGWMSVADRRRAFIEDLNDKITGAVSGPRRYGWLFYFVEIDDLALLHRMDAIIGTMFQRLPDFAGQSLNDVKRLSRTYYEARFSPERGYIRNYNGITSVAERLQFLIRHGVVDPADADSWSVPRVLQLFEQERARHLRELEVDVGFLY
jgi:hypothetical protein